MAQAMRQIHSRALGEMPVGVTRIPVTELPANTRKLHVNLGVRHKDHAVEWPAGALIDVELEVSYDGGVTWLGGGAMHGASGESIDKFGNAHPFGGFIAHMPSTGAGEEEVFHYPTHVKGLIRVSGTRCKTAFTLEAE